MALTSPQNDINPCVALNLFQKFQFSFNCFNFFRPPSPLTTFISTFRFIILFVAFHFTGIHPFKNDCSPQRSLATFLFFSIHILLCFVRIRLKLSECVRCLYFPFCVHDCTVFVSFRFSLSLFSFLVCAFEQCEYCIIQRQNDNNVALATKAASSSELALATSFRIAHIL